ncbi:nuclear GTPase SLIP-GC-like [Callorhinchus milii]|uniref:nuclear GTPase SLIP-GC-like n=1 Tax=Callorhinchus milii TaxID=7868 RepID=UPI001C3FC385|nr:nuclear GTPase SLIP-GC-like [Callorhinchus milii]
MDLKDRFGTMEVDNSDDDIIHTGVTRKRTTVTTTTTTKFSSDTPSKTKGCATTSKVSPQKKRKRQSAGAQMSEENKEVLQLCKDLEKETRDLINKVHMKLENVGCTDPEEKELLITLKEKASILKSKTLLDKIYIGVFGKTGDGKSSLINAVLHKHGLLPTSSCTACTSSIINVETYSGRRFKADIEFITEEVMVILSFMLLVSIIGGQIFSRCIPEDEECLSHWEGASTILFYSYRSRIV